MHRFIEKSLAVVKPLSVSLRLASGALCGIGLAVLAGPAQAFQVVAPNLPYGGKSQFEWAKSFWVNVLDAPDAGNPQYPASDGSSLYMINQPDSPVFFLSGTTTGESTTRSIRVRNDKALFFPIFNAFAVEPERANFNGTDLCAETAFFYPDQQTLFASVDGVAIGDSASLTTNFQQGCRANSANPDSNIFKTNETPRPQLSFLQNFIATYGIPPYLTADLDQPWDTVTDGYWVMLEPLSTGEHTIRFGMTPSPEAPNQYFQDNIWIVNSVEAPAPLPLLGAAAAFGWSRRFRRRLGRSVKSTLPS